MIENLPKQITKENLQNMDFGNIEANDDNLLFESVCYTSAMTQFINGSKSIITGEKGTGKTALFRLIKENKIKFNPKNGYKNVNIHIEDHFQYKHIKGKLLKLIIADSEEDSFKFHIVWELFFFHKMIQSIEKLDLNLPKEIRDAINLSNNIYKKTPGELLSFKKKFGVKFHDTATSILPDFYYETEPAVVNPAIKNDALNELEIDIDYYKEKINSFLKNNKLNIILLVDRLDEFVSKSSFPVQKEMLEALIAVEREYSRYSNIELKIFLRDDLFKQLDFDGIGYDKVITKKVELVWSPDKIREFIAKRIYSNYIKTFNISKLTIDNEVLNIANHTPGSNYVKLNFFKRSYRAVIKKINPQHYAQKFPREVNLTDKIYKQLILTLFPRYVDFVGTDGKKTEVDIFDYFSENFNLRTGNSIPRLILIFLNKCLEVVNNYYKENPDQLPIKQSEYQCFELMKKGFFEEAYAEFKKEIYINFSKLNPEFENNIMLLKEKLGKKYTFRAKDLKGLLNIEEEEWLYFCSYILHIGLVKRTNSSTTIPNMKFEIPIMFRK